MEINLKYIWLLLCLLYVDELKQVLSKIKLWRWDEMSLKVYDKQAKLKKSQPNETIQWISLNESKLIMNFMMIKESR